MRFREIFLLLLLSVGACTGAQDGGKTSGIEIAPDDSTVQYGYGEPLEVADPTCDLQGNPIAEFRDVFKKHGETATISGCNRIVEWAVPVAYGNRYFGAELRLTRNSKPVLAIACFEESVGLFELQEIPEPVSKRQLIEFTVQNCGRT